MICIYRIQIYVGIMETPWTSSMQVTFGASPLSKDFTFVSGWNDVIHLSILIYFFFIKRKQDQETLQKTPSYQILTWNIHQIRDILVTVKVILLFISSSNRRFYDFYKCVNGNLKLKITCEVKINIMHITWL